jgi:hypothetical protein
MMRVKLTKLLSLRVAPFIKFHLDEGLKKELAVLDLIRKANEEDRERVGSDPAAEPQASSQASSIDENNDEKTE